VSFWVVFFLIAHWLFGMDRKTGEAIDPEKHKRISRDEVRIYGRHFMLQVTLFMFTIGLAALIFSRTETWTYFNGIYFIVVTALTIGFGDFYPTTTPGRIILFPFDILLICQLAIIVSSIATFFNERTQKVTKEKQRLYEIQHHEEKDKTNPNPDLNDELEFLQDLYREVQRKHQMHEILISTIVFLCFWLIGAVAFWQIEVSHDASVRSKRDLTLCALGLDIW
jgi:potassium channel subfamily K